jgi:hypothetical protein
VGRSVPGKVHTAHGLSLAILVLVEGMYRRRRCSSLPVLSRLRFRPGPRHPLAATVAATALSLGVALAACSSGDDPETGSDQSRSTTCDDSSVGPSSDPDVVLTFGDPGEAWHQQTPRREKRQRDSGIRIVGRQTPRPWPAATACP